MKKLWLLSPFILSVLASPLCSDEIEAVSFDANELSKGFVLGQSRQKKMNGDKSGCTTCCDPEMHYRLPANFWGVDTFVEYLLWQVQEQASYFVANNTPSTFDNAYSSTFGQGTIRSQKFDWNSGVRAGFGYSFGRDVWQLLGQYTWYHTSGKSSYSVQTPLLSSTGSPIGTNYLVPLVINSGISNYAKASSSASFSYQMADLLLSSAFLATDQIQFNYSFGLTGGYVKENWDAIFIIASNPSSQIGRGNAYWHNHWKFGGGGFRIGADTNWHMGRGFGLFGKLSFAAILGSYTVHSGETNDNSSFNLYSNVVQNATAQKIMLVPTSQFILGLDWTRTFLNCWISALKVSLAGEFNHLANLQQEYQCAEPANAPTQEKPTMRNIGSVYMYGGTAHFGADF